MKNTFGSNISLTIFGESHGPAIGAVLDGLAAGIPVDADFVARQMDKRRARGDGLSTARQEPDRVEFVSGVYNGRTTGTPLCIMIQNTAQRSGDYAKTAGLARPGHADYAAHQKYQGFEDFRGGGHFSGRLTAPLVAAGALCRTILAGKGIRLGTRIQSVGGVKAGCPFSPEPETLSAQLQMLEARTGFALTDPAEEETMKNAIRAAAAQGDSLGGVLETAALGLPAGLGEPFFDSVESTLAHLMFSVPAVKGVEFGLGFALADLAGSAANDPLAVKEGRVVTLTNNNGGINGGITNGMPLVFRAAYKPTPSIYKPQQTVDLSTGQEALLQIQGRHDPCIVPRAAVVQTSAAAFGLLDLLTARYGTLWQREGL